MPKILTVRLIVNEIKLGDMVPICPECNVATLSHGQGWLVLSGHGPTVCGLEKWSRSGKSALQT